VRERFYVELAPRYVRLRHQLGLRTVFGRRRLGPVQSRLVRAMEEAEEAGQSIVIGPPDPDEYAELLAREEAVRREVEDDYRASRDRSYIDDPRADRDLAAAKEAAAGRMGRGAKGMSECSRREMWRWVLSLPFDMLGERPLWTPPIGTSFGGDTAVEMLRWWAQIVTGGTVENHARRGVNVRTVFYARNDKVATEMRRSAIAAYMAGEAAKAGQKVPPVGFGTVGRYFGTFGHRAGFRPVVEVMEIDEDVWLERNRRLTLLDSLRRRAKGRPLSDEAKRRRPWQGLIVGGLGPDEYGRLYARAHAGVVRKRKRRVSDPVEPADTP
jgi:hypothetical protein